MSDTAVAHPADRFEVDRFRTAEERKKHFGLLSMSHRSTLAGGRLDVDTAPGHGSRVRATFPLAA